MLSFNLRMLVVVAVLAVLGESRRQPAELSQSCTKELNTLNDPKVQESAAKCEQEGKYPEKVIAALQKADEKAAVDHAADMFVKCAKFSEPCAKEVAPGLVMKVRFSGAAVSEPCMQEAMKAQNDPKLKDFTEKCEKEEKLGEKILMALNKNDIDKAMGAAEHGLEKCMKMSDSCAYQVAPVIVNSVVMQAMQAQAQQQQQQEIPQTVVLAAHPVNATAGTEVLSMALPTPQKGMSLFNFFKSAGAAPVPSKAGKAGKAGKALRAGTAPVLLQESAHSVWVSKLLVQLAKRRF